MKLLIVRVGAMGDVLHALPAVTALRQLRPDWQIDWAIDPRWAPLLLNAEGRGPCVNAVHLVPTKDWSRAPFSGSTFNSVRSLRKALRHSRYDLAVDMQGTLRSAVIGRMAGTPGFAGYSDPRESLAASLYKRTLQRTGTHVVDQSAALLGDACDLTLHPATVELPHEAWADHWAEDLVSGTRVCLLSPSAGWAAKCWPVGSFAALARELRAAGFKVLVNAPAKDDATANALIAASDGAAERVICNVTGLLALLRRTSLQIGGDSGPTHLAAALGIPTIALFGPTNPARNGPWGPGAIRILRSPSSLTSYKKSAAPDPGLTQISVDQVLAAVAEIV